MTWPFDQARNAACITTQAVLNGNPVLTVTHFDDDDSWGFSDSSSDDLGEARIVSMETVVDGDPDLLAIADLPPGWKATRQNSKSEWVRAQIVT